MNKSANEIIKNLKLEITNYRNIQQWQEEETKRIRRHNRTNNNCNRNKSCCR